MSKVANAEDFFGPDPHIVNLQAEDRWEAIDGLVNHLADNNKIKAEFKEPIIAAIKKRESSMSTGIGFGIGIPHAATESVEEVVQIIGRSRKGIRFDALDGKPVHLVVLFLVPQGQFQKHAHILAKLAKQLHREDFRRRYLE